MNKPKNVFTIDELRNKKVFCTKAWSALSVSPSGSAFPCCLFEKPISDENDRPYRVWETDISEIYNSEFMQDIRRKMLDGEEVEACRQCYQSESYGGDSMRVMANHEGYETIAEYTVSDEEILPVSIDLKLNNKCNLKCRMCQPRDSHLIQSEFSKIIKEDESFGHYSNTDLIDPDLKIPLTDIPSWDDSDVFLKSFNKMLPSLKKISMVGGEPLLMNQFYQVLDLCIEKNYAKNIFVAVTTNLMYAPKEKLNTYLDEFYSFLFNISLDAVGKPLNYIRYPSTIEKIEKNFKSIYREDEAGLINFQFTPTVQVYNALYISEVYSFVDRILEEGFRLSVISVQLNYLTFPLHLNIRALPENIRKLTIKRLKAFLISSKHLANNSFVVKNYMQLINTLKNDFLPDSERIMGEFLYYSNCLDKTRDQSLQDYLPELSEALTQANIKALKPIPNFHKVRDNGWKLSSEGKLREAIKCFEESVQLSDDQFIDFREMAWMTLELEDFQKALYLYKKAYQLKNDDMNIVMGLATVYRCLGQNIESNQVLNEGKELFKDNPTFMSHYKENIIC